MFRSSARRASGRVEFSGRIAGFGSTSGTRFVVGLWSTSPLGRFADVMIEDSTGHRLLIAPTQSVADFVSATYTFDEVRIVPVDWRYTSWGVELRAGELELAVRVGGVSALGRLLRIVPRRLSRSPLWLTAIDPIARVLVPGVRTAGSAGSGRREYYGVSLAREIEAVSGRWRGAEIGTVARLEPPVRFGFASAPPTPSVVDVTTTITGVPES
ncbi:hypothetical protein ACPEEZ_12340 [Frigoribacterium sp. 2-23]|uniref:hypothetical protein n=1 Tax=Frigoribacterium sp. 2-23 TaxID=3415006 RepID=UPI003C6FCB3D